MPETPEPRHRLRSIATVVAALLAAAAFAAGMTALAEWIASPHVGLENIPATAEPAPAVSVPSGGGEQKRPSGHDDHGRHEGDHDDD